MDKFWGMFFLATYIFAVGIGSFLQKFVMGKVSPYQLEVITAIGMFVVSVPALLYFQKSLSLPIKEAPLSLLVGLLFSLGSFVYVLAVSKLPVSLAAPISTGYVVVAVILSALFLKEPITTLKAIGILLTVVGVAILSL
jgi:drug/metabolite transporter (DMT)-like permease